MKENVTNENEKQEISDLLVWNQRAKPKVKWKTVKNFYTFTPSKSFIFILCMYKMVDNKNGAETWNKAKVSVIKIYENKNSSIITLYFWHKKRWYGKNLSDLIDKEIKRKYGVKNMSDLTKQQIRKYKINRAKLIKSSKHSMYFHEDILIPIII